MKRILMHWSRWNENVLYHDKLPWRFIDYNESLPLGNTTSSWCYKTDIK